MITITVTISVFVHSVYSRSVFILFRQQMRNTKTHQIAKTLFQLSVCWQHALVKCLPALFQIFYAYHKAEHLRVFKYF